VCCWGRGIFLLLDVDGFIYKNFRGSRFLRRWLSRDFDRLSVSDNFTDFFRRITNIPVASGLSNKAPSRCLCVVDVGDERAEDLASFVMPIELLDDRRVADMFPGRVAFDHSHVPVYWLIFVSGGGEGGLSVCL
jgi:hypothetical protein